MNILAVKSTQEKFLSEMTSPEVVDKLKETNIALVPIGSVEGHGPHMPLNCDIFNATEIAKRVARRAREREIEVVITPPLYFGFSEFMKYPGTLSLRSDTFKNVIKDICRSLIRNGFTKILLINGHGGNTHVALEGIQDVFEEMDVVVAMVEYWDIASDIISKVIETPFLHADEGETSVALALRQHVQMDKATKTTPRIPFKEYDKLSKSIGKAGRTAHRPMLSTEIEESGVLGDATLANEEKGREIVNVAVERIVDFLEMFKDFKI